VPVVLAFLAPVPAGAAEPAAARTDFRAEVWTAASRGSAARIPATDPVPDRAAAPTQYDDVNCTLERHVRRGEAESETESQTAQTDACNAIMGAFIPARRSVDDLVGHPLGRGIEIVLLTNRIRPSGNVPAQSTAVRPGTVACYPDGTFENDDPSCGGLPPVGAQRDADWACQIQIGGDFRGLEAPVRRTSLAHEYFHCHQRAVSASSVGSFFRRTPWLIEGSAAWVGERYANGSSISRGWWAQAVKGTATNLYAEDACPILTTGGPPNGCIFGRPKGYSAIAFWFALAGTRGEHQAASAALDAVTIGAVGPAAMDGVAGPTDPVWPTWAGFARRWRDGGSSWDLRAPGNDQGRRQEWSRELTLTSGPQVEVTATFTENKIVDVSWQAVRQGEQNMAVELDGVTVLRWLREGGQPVGSEVTTSGSPERLEVCIHACRPGAPRPPDGATRLVVAIAGTGSTSSRVRVAVACPSPISSPATPTSTFATSAPISRCCLVGDWVMSQAPTYARFRTINGGVGQTMTIEPDGRLVADYDPMVPWEVEDTSDASGGTVVMKLNGQATATIDLERLVTSRRLRKVATDFSGVTVSASVRFPGEGELDFGTQPFSEWFGIVVAIAGEPPPETGVGLECSATTLTLTDSASGISHEFTRVSEPVCSARSCSTRPAT